MYKEYEYMMNRIKEYFAYRRNRRIARREFAKLTAAALPGIHALVEYGKELAESVQKMTAAAKPESESTDNGAE